MFIAKPGVIKAALSPNRIEALTDGVFAIVMTLLVLDLGIPVIAESSVHTELPRQLLEMWPKFLSYAVTFLLLGFLWSVHHYQFTFIKRSDSVLTWINIVFLMFVALLPFSMAMLGEYMGEQIPVLIYGGNAVACMVMRYILWSYATGNHRLIDRDIDPRAVKGPKVMLPVGIAVFIVAMGISFLNTIASICIFAVMLIFMVIRSTLLYRTSATHPATK